jgi:alpha/beta superfamily hydrolase
VSGNSLRLATNDGGEIVADVAEAGEARASAVLCHPHPAYGGDRHNIVVDTLFRRLPEAGIAALRFDFRSDDLESAQADVAAAIAHVAGGDQPLWLIGYSFGGDVALSVGDERIAGWVAVAPPLRFGGGGGGSYHSPAVVRRW